MQNRGAGIAQILQCLGDRSSFPGSTQGFSPIHRDQTSSRDQPQPPDRIGGSHSTSGHSREKMVASHDANPNSSTVQRFILLFAASGMKAPTKRLIGPHTIKQRVKWCAWKGLGTKKMRSSLPNFSHLTTNETARSNTRTVLFPIRNPSKHFCVTPYSSLNTNLTTVQLPSTPPEYSQIFRTHSYVNSESDTTKA